MAALDQQHERLLQEFLLFLQHHRRDVPFEIGDIERVEQVGGVAADLAVDPQRVPAQDRRLGREIRAGAVQQAGVQQIDAPDQPAGEIADAARAVRRRGCRIVVGRRPGSVVGTGAFLDDPLAQRFVEPGQDLRLELLLVDLDQAL